ncbi:hypothetical protein DV736_g6470, partial [Chaetothyriales sp. CBS 134916]
MSYMQQRTWWKDAVVYQIWPASFKDSDGDGLGDLKGILESLDHIQSLGANVVWLSPIFESPQADLGYDISDYERIYRPYGTISDLRDIIKSCHSRGIRLLLDLVINHTSDQHAWFQESRSSQTATKRDWYIWRPAKYENRQRKPPNNWQSMFGGSAWEWDEGSGEYYLHLFSVSQPDVNWRNPELRQAIYQSALKFWLKEGIDGFRIDAMGLFAKDPSFADALENNPHAPFNHRPENFEIFHEIQNEMKKYGDLMTVGEFGGLSDTGTALQYVSSAQARVNMGFQFETVCIGYALSTFNVKPFRLHDFKELFAKWQQFIEGTDGWTTIFLENHDVARSVSRFASDKPGFRAAAAKMLALLQVSATGTLFLYQGQEIGMTNIPADWPIEQYKDLSTQEYWRSVKESTDDPVKLIKAMANIRKVARDHGRTPMQWSSDAHGGFTVADQGPWMRVNDNYTEINVKAQLEDEDSVLSFWKRAILLRREHIDLLAHGKFQYVDNNSETIMCFKKIFGNRTAIVLLNFSESEQPYQIPDTVYSMSLEISTSTRMNGNVLGPFEGRLYIA